MQERLISIYVAAIFLLLGAVLPAFAQEPFYKGKTIRMIVATSAGGGFDAYTRMIARHIGKHVPGQPAITVENMPGAGHLIGANHMYKVAKPDGLTVGHFQGGYFFTNFSKNQALNSTPPNSSSWARRSKKAVPAPSPKRAALPASRNGWRRKRR